MSEDVGFVPEIGRPVTDIVRTIMIDKFEAKFVESDLQQELGGNELGERLELPSSDTLSEIESEYIECAEAILNYLGLPVVEVNSLGHTHSAWSEWRKKVEEYVSEKVNDEKADESVNAILADTKYGNIYVTIGKVGMLDIEELVTDELRPSIGKLNEVSEQMRGKDKQPKMIYDLCKVLIEIYQGLPRSKRV